MRSVLLTNVAIQSIGTLSLFALVIAISRIGGPQAQGLFATVKSWTDFLCAVGQLGLPQAFVYVINKGYAAPRPLFRMSLVYASGFAVVASIATMLAVLTEYLEAPHSFSLVAIAILLALNVGGMTLHNLVRGLLLPYSDGTWFALFSIAAPVVLAVCVTTTFVFFHAGLIEFAFAFAGILCGILAVAVGAVITKGRSEPSRIDFHVLIGQSASSFALSILLVLQPVLTIALMKWWGADNHAIGLFNVASMAMMVSNVLFAMVSPTLFNRWSKSLSMANARGLFLRMSRWALLVAGLSLIASALIPFLMVPIFGAAFAEATGAAQILALGLAPVFYSRMSSAAMLGLGLPHWNAAIAGARIVCIVLSLPVLAWFGHEIIVSAALGWTIAEWLTAVLTFFAMTSRRAVGYKMPFHG
jgi:O-antigen/teichoic acid export membrane protein